MVTMAETMKKKMVVVMEMMMEVMPSPLVYQDRPARFPEDGELTFLGQAPHLLKWISLGMVLKSLQSPTQEQEHILIKLTLEVEEP